MFETPTRLTQTSQRPPTCFKMWKSHCEEKEKRTQTAPAAADLKPLTEDRVTPSVLVQTGIFLTREARKWNKSSFLTTCTGLFFCGLLFGVLMQAVAEFSYASILQVTT